jgi:hypothetical protein
MGTFRTTPAGPTQPRARSELNRQPPVTHENVQLADTEHCSLARAPPSRRGCPQAPLHAHKTLLILIAFIEFSMT